MSLLTLFAWAGFIFGVRNHVKEAFHELSVEMAKAIPNSSLWILPNSGHGPVIGEGWNDFIRKSAAFLRG